MDPLRARRLDDEIRHHIEERVDRLIAQGMDPDEARRRAEASFGDVERVRAELEHIEEPPRSSLARGFERVRADLGFSLRQMRRAPGFAVAAVLTLGLGIGAAASIFGLVKAVVLDPLPYPDGDRLVVFNEVAPDGGRFNVSELNFRDFRARVRSLEDLTALRRSDLTLVEDGRPLNVVAQQVTGSFFSLFGGSPVVGRAFTDAESGEDAQQLAVVSNTFWRSHLNGDPGAVGHTLVLDGIPYQVVGVMPPRWNPVDRADVWVPIPFHTTDRSDHDLDAVARLAPGATLQSSTADVEAVADGLGREYPTTNGDWGARVTSLKEVLVGPQRIRAGWVLLGAVGLLLLLACASVSNLLLARASTRGREMDLRVSLGAGRGRLVQQLLTESVVLAGAGAASGLALAYAFLPILRALSPADTPRIGDATVDGAVILVAVLMALGTGLVFGLAPVIHLMRGGSHHPGRSATRVAGHGGERFRGALVAAQVAVSLTLLYGTATLGASFLRLQSTDTGMDVDHTQVVPLMLSGDRYTVGERVTTVGELHQRLSALPGVEAVGATNINPFSGANTVININTEGQPTTAETAPFVLWRAVSPGFFRAANLDLLAGRTLTSADAEPDAEEVVVVTRTLARSLFGDPSAALDRRIAFGWDGTNYRRIVGVVSDLEDRELATTPPAMLFFAGQGYLPWSVFLVRYRPGTTMASAAAVRQAIWEVDPGLPVPAVGRLSDGVRSSAATPRFNLLVMALFGGVALVLSVMALYGLVLFALRQRTREIGVRLALGARPGGVVGVLLRRGVVVTAGGVLAGIGGSVALSRFMEALVFGGGALDPLTLGGAAVTVAAASLAATWIPASRATRVDPREALSAE